ncbi:MAG: hypothetical protein JF601_06200 [Acidobacteria bacterium]|nr:hypothetical protein [Acidobacteriota bacterium]
MMATRAASLPDGGDWSYEVKWDGYRAQVIKSGDLVALASRNLKDITRQFPAIAGAVARMPAQSAILDGEIVALDREGRPSFQALHHWSFDGLSLVYYAFDLLHLNGRDLTKRPLDERRAALRTVVDGTAPLLLSEPLPGKPQEITEAVRRLGLEGVVAKKRRSTYTPGRRSEAWIKVRFAQRQELVIGGYKPSATAFDSLLVGFANLPSSKSSHWGEGITLEEMSVIHWLKPVLVAEVSFAEWTRDGSLRHAAFIGLRDDKPARSVVREG